MDDKPLLDDEENASVNDESIQHPMIFNKSVQIYYFILYQKKEVNKIDQEDTQQLQQQHQQQQQQQQPIQQQLPMQQQQAGQLLNQQQIMELIQTLQKMTPPQRQQYMANYSPQIQQQVMMAWQQMALQQQQIMQQQQLLQQQQQKGQQQQLPQQMMGMQQQQPIIQQQQQINFPQPNQQRQGQQQELSEAQKLQKLQQELHQKHKKLTDPFEGMSKNFQQPGGCYASCLGCCGDNCGSILQYLCFCCFNPRVEIQTQTEGLIERFGRYHDKLGPGLHFVNPWTDKVTIIDLKKQTLNLAQQVALTKDNITISIDASINYVITNSRIATYGVFNIDDAISLFTKATLRNICGQMELQELLEKKDEIKTELIKIIDEHVYIWGVEIENIFIKNMVVSGSVMQDAVSIATQNRRYAESKVISAQADVETAKMQQKAADELSSDAAMQIRYLQILERIAVTQGTRIVFYPKAYKKQAKAAYDAQL